MYLNVSGRQGHLTVDNLSGFEFNALASKQSFIPNNQWTGVNAMSIRLGRALARSTDYWVFLNTGAASLVISFNFNVI